MCRHWVECKGIYLTIRKDYDFFFLPVLGSGVSHKDIEQVAMPCLIQAVVFPSCVVEVVREPQSLSGDAGRRV